MSEPEPEPRRKRCKPLGKPTQRDPGDQDDLVKISHPPILHPSDALPPKRRDRIVTLRVTDQEYATWKEAQRRQGYKTLADYIRAACGACLDPEAIPLLEGLNRIVDPKAKDNQRNEEGG